MFLNNNWILLEFLKTFIKVYALQVFVNVRRNFIFSGHHVWQVLKDYLQPCCHPPHFSFCRQYCCIWLGYNTRKRNFWYLVSYIFCFSFCLLFYLDGMSAVQKYKLLLPLFVKNNMHQTNTIFVMNSYRPFIFNSNVQKNIWRKSLK